jgi:hypothetical protein
MSQTKTAEHDSSLITLLPTDPQWKVWSDRRYVKYWCAVLLTMYINPTIANRNTLREQHPELYQTYLDRMSVLFSRSLKRKSLQVVPEENPSDRKKDRCVDLFAVVRFASEVGWDARGLLVAKVLMPNSEPDVDQELDGISTSLSNTFTRYGALVQLLQLAIDKPNEFNSLCQKADSRQPLQQVRSARAC